MMAYFDRLQKEKQWKRPLKPSDTIEVDELSVYTCYKMWQYSEKAENRIQDRKL